MKKVIAILLMVTIAALLIPAVALAASSANDKQIITGNTEATISIVAPADVLNWNLIVPDAAGDINVKDFTGTAGILVNSNVIYDVAIRADKATMSEWDGTDYVSSGKIIQLPLQIKSTLARQAITTSDAALDNLSSLAVTPNGGTNSDIHLFQRTGYGDTRLIGGNVYRTELTYTASMHP